MAAHFEIPLVLIESLRAARHVAALTGSGISAESGIPTFRDAQTGPSASSGQALWSKYRPEELATPEAFRRNPRLVWEWYEWRRGLVAKAAPNPGHLALAELERRVPRFTLITQNVDGLHQQAGSRNVIELHGNLRRTKCFDENGVVDAWPATDDVPPRCPRCGGLLRPDVVWFGEALPQSALAAAIEAAQTCDLFFAIGTSALVQPAASLPFQAIQRGVVTVEINADATPLTPRVTHALCGSAGEVLPALLKALTPYPLS
ncbi:MAG: NAD-dependent protein deacylase [Anaerolineales bacterium]|nr:NAD-dependent protein deacylase [Anaerolineales bacterium]MBM2849327.1 NAD-dependent protein deacylase [Anaerolineales bacterium]